MLVLAATRSDVTGLNAAIRRRLIETGALGPDELTVDRDDDGTSYRVGDQVLITANDRHRGLTNGIRATVTGINPRTGRLHLDVGDNKTVSLDRARLTAGAVTHGYATTVHKAQGITVDTTLIYGLGPLTREHGYVAMSRGRSANHLYLTGRAADRFSCGPPQSQHVEEAYGLTAELIERLNDSRRHSLASSQIPAPQPDTDRDDEYHRFHDHDRYYRDNGRGR